jgi:hypothetical protein
LGKERKMPYQATVISIMIASPGDVFEEREIVRAAIYNWNYINAIKTKVILTPAGWETHSSPELGTRSQELINNRILKNCDLLVGIFWTRLGTPTGKSQSGTVEEIDEHIKSGKPAMIYFSSKPVALESVDIEQYNAVKAFKEQCKEQGLIQEFDNVIDFREKFSHQLQVCLNTNPYMQSILRDGLAITDEAFATTSKTSKSKYKISEDAQTLLSAAAERDDGMILMAAVIGGRFVQAGGQTFGGESSRESARWEYALNELLDNNLVIARGHKGEVFELNYEGWALADELKKRDAP